MNKEFVNDLRDALMKELQEDGRVTDIEIQDVTKNNGTVHTGLVFKGESEVAPVIYADRAFEMFESGVPMDEIVSDMVDTFNESQNQKPMDTSKFLQYDAIKDKIIVCAMNAQLNEAKLETTPHQMVEDIAVYCRVIVNENSEGLGSIVVNDELLNAYGVSEEELFEQAWANTKANYPAEVTDMIDVLQNTHADLPDFIKEEMDSHRGEMFVLSNPLSFNGSAYGFDKETLDGVCDKIGEGTIYVLPSSVNEVIVVPGSKVHDPKELSEIVVSVNSAYVSEQEFLSDNAYCYEKDSQELTTTEPASSMDIKSE